jgi:hypothetical protein
MDPINNNNNNNNDHCLDIKEAANALIDQISLYDLNEHNSDL